MSAGPAEALRVQLGMGSSCEMSVIIRTRAVHYIPYTYIYNIILLYICYIAVYSWKDMENTLGRNNGGDTILKHNIITVNKYNMYINK